MTLDDSKVSIIKDQVPAKTGFFVTKKLLGLVVTVVAVLLAVAILATYFASSSSTKTSTEACESLFCKNVQAWSDKCFNLSTPDSQTEFNSEDQSKKFLIE